MSKHLVLSCKTYDFQNNNGERVAGAKIAYINKRPTNKEGEFGYPPLIVSIHDKNAIEQLKEVPAIYEMDFEQITGKNNKPELLLVGVEHIASADLSQFF